MLKNWWTAIVMANLRLKSWIQAKPNNATMIVIFWTPLDQDYIQMNNCFIGWCWDTLEKSHLSHHKIEPTACKSKTEHFEKLLSVCLSLVLNGVIFARLDVCAYIPATPSSYSANQFCWQSTASLILSLRFTILRTIPLEAVDALLKQNWFSLIYQKRYFDSCSRSCQSLLSIVWSFVDSFWLIICLCYNSRRQK